MPINRIYKVNPLDLQPNVAIGVSLPFNGNAVFNSTYKTEEQIKYNLINFLLTNRGERVENPRFGSDLRRFLFEFIVDENIDEIRQLITEGVKNYIPEISVMNIDIIPEADYNQIEIKLSYKVKLSGNTDNVVLNLT